MQPNIMEIKKRCGSICSDTIASKLKFMGALHSNVYDPVFEKIPVVCESLWNTSLFEEPSPFKYPIQILPKYLLDHYSSNGGVRVTPHYYADVDTENHVTNSWGIYCL